MTAPHLPIPPFLARLAATARALWSGRVFATAAWRQHRRCDIALLTDGNIHDLAAWGAIARGVN